MPEVDLAHAHAPPVETRNPELRVL
eukprot:COSAG04_NODE_6150_length_1397_cov_1.109399_1_plen_24_part_10